MKREEAINRLRDIIIEIRTYCDESKHMSETDRQNMKAFDMAIKALEQEPKTGHWEWAQYDYNPNIGNWHCSECKNIAVVGVNKNEEGGIPIYKYCPNCGAKMVEPQESEGKE